MDDLTVATFAVELFYKNIEKLSEKVTFSDMDFIKIETSKKYLTSLYSLLD